MSALEKVIKLVQEWNPDAFPSELKYRDSLAAFLQEQLKKSKSRIETEYRHNGTTVDVYVKKPGVFGSTEVFVELKRNLLQKTQLDRMVGQIASIDPKKCAVLVVLCGETDPALVKRFKEMFGISDDFFFDISMFSGAGIVVIVKELAKKSA